MTPWIRILISLRTKGGNESRIREEYERWRCPISAVRRCDDEEFYRDIEVRCVDKCTVHFLPAAQVYRLEFFHPNEANEIQDVLEGPKAITKRFRQPPLFRQLSRTPSQNRHNVYRAFFHSVARF